MMKKMTIILGFLALCFTTASAQALTLTLNFFGECDDCSFIGDPGDPGFDYESTLNDGLTEPVTARLIMDGLFVGPDDVIDFRGEGSVIFQYDGSSLINPFAMHDPYLFRDALRTDGSVVAGLFFEMGSTQNLTNPGNPLSFDFPNFCTPLGQQVLGRGDCDSVGDVRFFLDDQGNWSISGDSPSDIGSGGQFSVVPVPAAAWLFASGILGLVSFARRKQG